jgi:polar amino acid transport system substrate-binding protein
VQPYIDLALGRLDAVVMDTPIALYYATGPQVRNIEIPAARMAFGIGVRKADAELLDEINAALSSTKRDGSLRQIYTNWGIYNAATAQAFGDPEPVSNDNAPRYRDYLDAIRTERTFKERLGQYKQYLPLLLRGALVTLEISALSMAIAIGLGLLMAVLRVFGPPLIAWPVVAFIEVIRGTPLLIQLFIIFYGLPSIGVRFSPLWAAVIGLGVNYAAYEAENYRAGIQSIPRGQLDAAVALGLTRIQTIRRIVLPQAVRLVIPPVTNDFIALLKDSSLVSVITMVELTKMYGQLAATNYDYIGIGLATAAIYFLLGLPIARLSRLLEARLAYMKV